MERFEKPVDEVNKEEESFQYPLEKVVYLSADGDETLENLKKDELYIIGGIVDRNRYKFLTLEKAKRLGVRCAKLPLELVKFHGSRVLTVNNGTNETMFLQVVVELLVQFNNSPDWTQVIQKSVPMRKIESSFVCTNMIMLGIYSYVVQKTRGHSPSTRS